MKCVLRCKDCKKRLSKEEDKKKPNSKEGKLEKLKGGEKRRGITTSKYRSRQNLVKLFLLHAKTNKQDGSWNQWRSSKDSQW